MNGVREAIAEVRIRIARAGGDPEAVTIVGAKPPSVEACHEAIAAGVVDLGENRAQDLLSKVPFVDGARWHFIGRLQTNKVRLLAPHVALWESVDRSDVVAELTRRAPGAAVLVQVNISGEPQKGGCAPTAARALVEESTAAGLVVRGLMGIGLDGAPERARPGFALLARLADELGLEARSMGMSNDLEVAVQEGATMVRVGTGLFGPRPRRDLPPD